MSKLFFALGAIVLCLGCTPPKDKINQSGTTTFHIKYAKGFKVSIFENYKIVEVSTPYKNSKKGYTYLLVRKGKEVPTHDATTEVITIPLETIVCTSTTHLPLLDYLGETNRLIGFPTTDYVSSEKMRARIDAGKVTDVGAEKGMNLELLATLHPSLVMGYTMTAELGQLKKVQELGMPVVVNAEYLEEHPLGRAEWIKFMALFFDKEQKADSAFNIIESEYLATQALVKDVRNPPTVMSGVIYGDTWFLPGGKNYAARLLEDAGLYYLWKKDTTRGFQELGFEWVYAYAKNADLWIGVGSYKTLAEMKSAEGRYAMFKPYVTKNIYNYNARKGAKGGSEFLELGYLRPDFILKDLVKIGHPELLKDYQLYFHEALK